jgi:hypothetical protein
MPIEPSGLLEPLASSSFDEPAARHLLRRAGFDGTAEQVVALHQMGLHDAVEYMVEYQRVDDASLPVPDADPDILTPPTPEQRRMFAAARQGGDEEALQELRRMRNERQRDDRAQMLDMGIWWLQRMIETPRPLEEKLVLLWHDHFASNYRFVRDSYLMLQQNRMFRENANGSFADLAHHIIRDPAMIRFLNNDSNQRRKPNENLARELMELFTLGEGNYSETDIKQGARALTGYSIDDNDFMFRPRIHDDGEKSILGSSGDFDGDAFVDILLQRPQCPRWVAYKLYRHFVADVDDTPPTASERVVDELAAELRQQDFELRPVLRKLFASEHFYGPAIRGAKIKSPTQLLVGAVRSMRTPVRGFNVLRDAMEMMGQQLFNPPSVAGWPGGRGWINTSTLFVRQNLCTYLISGKLPFEDGWSRDAIDYDPSHLLDGIEPLTAEAGVDRLLEQLIAVKVTDQRRNELVRFVNDSGLNKRDAVIAVLLLITAMPEYQLC